MTRPSLIAALFASLALHGAIGVWVEVRGTGRSRPVAPDAWSGSGVEIEHELPEVGAVTAIETDTAASRTDGQPPEAQVPEAVAVDVCRVDCGVEPSAAPSARAPSATPSAEPQRAPSPPSAASPLRTGAVARSAAPAISSGAAPSASSASSESQRPASGSLGAAGLPPGTRYLPHAYTRALPAGSRKIAAFGTAPAGPFCEARIVIRVDEEGRLGDVEYESEPVREALPKACRTMLENGRRLLHTGQFSVDPTMLAAGAVRLRVEVELRDGAPTDFGDSEMGNISHEPPSAGKRGRGSFTLNSGRRIDAWVYLE